MNLMDYKEALQWASRSVGNKHVLLGNGFGMSYDPTRFAYDALAKRASDLNLLSDSVINLMNHLETTDFERTMRAIDAAINTLKVLAPYENEMLIENLRALVDELREALAQSVAGLHPDRPYDIDEARYRSVRRFLSPFSKIYTVNYDLLLYWALMQEIEDGTGLHPARAHDDGFRASRNDDDPTVVWNIYDPFSQSVYYLHGALHLYLGDDDLRKLTWVRTDMPLIDQTRIQLSAGRYPHYVAESESSRKLDRINRSAYLSRGLRSLSSIGGSLTIYGHSLDSNDDHVLEAIVRSRVSRIVVSLYGDSTTDDNRRVIAAGRSLVERRNERPGRSAAPLEVRFYDAQTTDMWEAVSG